VPATVSFDVVWHRPVSRQVTVSDATDQFAGTFDENQATVLWSAQSTSGFRFNARAGNSLTSTPGAPDITTTYFFAEVGYEQNGIFFPAGETALGAAALVRTLGNTSAAPATTAPTLSPPQAAAAPVVSPTGNAQPIQLASTPQGLATGWTPARVIDQVFADLDGRTLWNPL